MKRLQQENEALRRKKSTMAVGECRGEIVCTGWHLMPFEDKSRQNDNECAGKACQAWCPWLDSSFQLPQCGEKSTDTNQQNCPCCIQCGRKCFLAALTRNICNSPKSETLCFEIRPVLFSCWQCNAMLPERGNCLYKGKHPNASKCKCKSREGIVFPSGSIQRRKWMVTGQNWVRTGST